MFCQKCGVENPEEAKFCKDCGQSIIYKAVGNNSFAPEITEKHERAKMFFENKMFKEAWNIYFEILETNPDDSIAKQMITDLRTIFTKKNSKENISSKFWFIVALIASLIVTIVFFILISI